MKKIFICIDLKSFFASCECSKRNLDPFTTNLVVADKTRGENALCLAITPAMKKLGIKNRCLSKIFILASSSISLIILDKRG